jgi:hypothetical protein
MAVRATKLRKDELLCMHLSAMYSAGRWGPDACVLLAVSEFAMHSTHS